jgi:uncharacterized protein
MSVARAAGLLKVVLDTNVYFSAFTSTRGVPFELWRRALRREFTVLTSPAILRELAEVLRMDLKWPERDIVAQLKLVAKVAQLVQSTTAVSAVADDPDDDRILECAIAGNADLIVTYDRHLTKLKTFRGIGIVRPVDFLPTLGG